MATPAPGTKTKPGKAGGGGKPSQTITGHRD